MSNFKIGDRVRVSKDNTFNTSYHPIGSVGTIIKIDKSTNPYKCKWDNKPNGYEEGWVSVVEHLKNNKTLKTVPVDKHIVIEDSCNNFHGIDNSYNIAVERAKGISGDTTIYKMVEVAKVSTVKQVKKKRK